MKHTLTITSRTFVFDDTVLLSNQPKWFQKLVEKNKDGSGIAIIDNITFIVYDTGRILINNIEEGGEDGV